MAQRNSSAESFELPRARGPEGAARARRASGRAGAFALFVSVLWAMSAAGCDPRADTEPEGGAAELESCSQSADCAADLRCVERTCVREAASTVGDYHAAVGRAALAEGDVGEAVERYSRAVSQYESDEIAPPARLYCEQGRALAAGRDERDRAELAARVLHRCVLQAPPGSEERRRALDELARLEELGLEPLALARSEPADAYLTRSAEPAEPDAIEVALDGGGGGARTFQNWVAHLEGEDLEDLLEPCWEAYWEEAEEEELDFEMGFTYDYRLGPTDDQDRAVMGIRGDPPSGEGAEEAFSCAKEAIEPVLSEFARRQTQNVGWAEEIEFEIGPAS